MVTKVKHNWQTSLVNCSSLKKLQWSLHLMNYHDFQLIMCNLWLDFTWKFCMPKRIILGFVGNLQLKDVLIFTAVLLLPKWRLSSHQNQAIWSSFSVPSSISSRFQAKIIVALINFEENESFYTIFGWSIDVGMKRARFISTIYTASSIDLCLSFKVWTFSCARSLPKRFYLIIILWNSSVPFTWRSA